MILTRIRDSMAARIIQPWIMRHYKTTKYGKKIAYFKGKYAGRRCFLIGNGPSLNVKDLEILKKNGEITFAFNRIYNIFEETSWRPDFYISQDEKMLAGCQKIVDGLSLDIKFIPIQLNWYYSINIHDALYFNFLSQPFPEPLPEMFSFSENAAEEIYCANTVMYTAVQLASYMGFSEIYFIGVDHQFHISQNNAGKIVIDNTVKDYFSDKYNEDREKLYIPNTEKSTLTYLAILKNCEEKNIKVYNATRGGKLEVFPRVEFDSLFNNDVEGNNLCHK